MVREITKKQEKKICAWLIPCQSDALPNEDYCGMHCRALGIKITKEKKAQKPIAKVSPKKKGIAEEKERKDRLTAFYDEQLNKASHVCLECGCCLYDSTVINERAIICHILPKRIFRTIETNEDNVINLCNTHHDTLDNGGKSKVIAMKIYPLLKERVRILLPLIPQEHLKSIPEYLL